MGCKVLEAGGGGSSLNVIFSGGRVAGATATVEAVAVLMEVAMIPMAMAAAATVAMEAITDIPNITIYTQSSSQRFTLNVTHGDPTSTSTSIRQSETNSSVR